MKQKIDDGLTKNQRWYRKNNGRERSRSRQAKARAMNPEANRQHCKKQYAKNVERRREKARKYYQEVSKAKLKSPEGRAKERMKKAKRRAIKAGVLATLTWQEWLAICQEYNYCCAYCSRKLPLEQDHKTPISKGGGHTKENVVPACKGCNSSKGARGSTPAHPCTTVTNAPSHVPNSKLTEETVRLIRDMAGTASQKEIGAMFGISHQQVSRVILRKSWSWVA